jgi:hypothetical protein
MKQRRMTPADRKLYSDLRGRYLPAAFRDEDARLRKQPKKLGRKPDRPARDGNTLALWMAVENKKRDRQGRSNAEAAERVEAQLKKWFPHDPEWRYKRDYIIKQHRAGARIMRTMPEVRDKLLDVMSRHRVRPVFNRHGARYFVK